MRTPVLLFAAAVSCGGSRPAETPGPAAATAATTTTASTTSDSAPATSAPATSTPPATSTAAAPTSGPSAASATQAPAPVSGGSVLLGDIPGTKKFNPKATIEEN